MAVTADEEPAYGYPFLRIRPQKSFVAETFQFFKPH